MARGQRSFRESVKARRTHWSAVSPHACACAHVHSSGLFLLSKRPLEHTTDYFPARSRVRAQFTMHRSRVTSPAQLPEMVSEPLVTPTVARILDRAKHGVLYVQPCSGFPEFTDVDAASLVAYLQREPLMHATKLNGYEMHSSHAAAIIDACAALGTIEDVWCSVHGGDQMDSHAAALTRWMRNEKHLLGHAQLNASWNLGRVPDVESEPPISDAAAADLFRASTNVRLDVKRTHVSIVVSRRDRAMAQVSAGPASRAAPKSFAARLACAALETSGGVYELSFTDSGIDDDDVAAVLDRLERFGSSVQRLTFDSCGRPLIENPAFHALVRTLPNLRTFHLYGVRTLRPEVLRELAAAVSVSKTLAVVMLWEAGLTSESCGAWHDALTRAPALRELTIRYDSLTREDCALLTRGAVFSRNACWLDLQNANGMGEDPSIPQEAARARLACAARFTTFAGAESLCGARSPARRFLEGDGDRAIVWRLLRLLGIQP